MVKVYEEAHKDSLSNDNNSINEEALNPEPQDTKENNYTEVANAMKQDARNAKEAIDPENVGNTAKATSQDLRFDLHQEQHNKRDNTESNTSQNNQGNIRTSAPVYSAVLQKTGGR